MNVYDSRYIEGILNSTNWEKTNDTNDADLIIINGCVVRKHAQNRAESIIKQLIHNKKENQKIIVTGCLGKYIENTIKGVDLFTGPAEWDKIKSFLNIENTQNIIPTPFTGITQFVTIIKGCNNFCRYCVVPYLRGKEISRTPEEIEKEIKEIVKRGYNSVLLLGQNVNAYNSTLDFPDLLYKLSKIEGAKRISFLTSHPEDFSDKLIDAINNSPSIMPYIHLPVQTLNNRLLKMMGRKYTVEEYLKLIEKIRNSKREISISTDIMVGYPTETEKEFEKILEIFKQIEFDSAYMYAYSPREWTVSALMETVNEKERKRRLQLLIDTQNEITKKKNKEMIGKIYTVITEKESTRNKNEWFGFAHNGKPVVFRGDSFSGEECKVYIEKLEGWTPYGKKI